MTDSQNIIPQLPEDQKIEKHNTGMQLALDIFNELDRKGLKIEQSEKEIGFRKNNLLITATSLTLNQKRLLDVLFFIAAQHIDNGAHHIEGVQKNKNGIYEIELSFFKWLLSLPKMRNSQLRSLMESISETKLQAVELFNEEEIKRYENKTDTLKHWQIHNFFGSLYLDIPNNTAAFSINPIFNDYIHNPKNFHFLSLCYVFPNLASKVLYDWIMLQPSLDTSILLTVEELRQELGQKNKRSFNVFSEFNRAFLTPAIETINDITNLNVNMTLHRGVRTQVTHIEFNIIEKEENNERDTYHRIEQYHMLRNNFGLLPKHFDEILKNRNEYTDERIKEAQDYVHYRLAQNTHIKSIPAYFMHALREGYHIGLYDAQKVEAIPRHRLVQKKAEEGFKTPLKCSVEGYNYDDADLSKKGWDHFHSLSSKQRSFLVDFFSKDPFIQTLAENIDIESTAEFIANQFALYPILSCAFGVFVEKNRDEFVIQPKNTQ